MLNRSEYGAYYEKNGSTPGSSTKRFLSSIGVDEYYRKYVLAQEKTNQGKVMYQKVHSTQKCQVLLNIPYEYIRPLKERASFSINKLEAAHIVQRSVDTEISNIEHNVVLINSYSHYLLDGYLDPIFGKFALSPHTRLTLMKAFKENNKKQVAQVLIEIYEAPHNRGKKDG